MVVVFDTLQSDMGVMRVDSNQKKHLCWTVSVSCFTADPYTYDIFTLRPNRSDTMRWDTLRFPIYALRNITDEKTVRVNMGDMVFIQKR